MFSNGAVFFRRFWVVPQYFPKMFQSPFFSVFLIKKELLIVATMSIWPSSKWCYFFEGIFSLYQIRPCSSVHHVMCCWRAHQVFKLLYLSAQVSCLHVQKKRHVNLETTFSMSHLNSPVVIRTSLGLLPICILPMTAWIHGIVSFGLYLLLLYQKVI